MALSSVENWLLKHGEFWANYRVELRLNRKDQWHSKEFQISKELWKQIQEECDWDLAYVYTFQFFPIVHGSYYAEDQVSINSIDQNGFYSDLINKSEVDWEYLDEAREAENGGVEVSEKEKKVINFRVKNPSHEYKIIKSDQGAARKKELSLS